MMTQPVGKPKFVVSRVTCVCYWCGKRIPPDSDKVVYKMFDMSRSVSYNFHPECHILFLEKGYDNDLGRFYPRYNRDGFTLERELPRRDWKTREERLRDNRAIMDSLEVAPATETVNLRFQADVAATIAGTANERLQATLANLANIVNTNMQQPEQLLTVQQPEGQTAWTIVVPPNPTL